MASVEDASAPDSGGGEGLARPERARRAEPPAAAASMPPRRPPSRYAEQASRRRSTCALADAVATAALQRWQALRPGAAAEAQRGPTVVAAFVLMEGAGNDTDNAGVERARPGSAGASLRAVAVGEGTKFLGAAARVQAGPERVRDCHAEVLARRALCRWLRAQLAAARAGCRPPQCALEPSGDGDGHFRLAAGLSLHLYVSSAPCGNACVRAWAKGAKECFREELGARCWPTEAHPTLFLSAAKEGQVAMLAKRDGDAPEAAARGSGGDGDGDSAHPQAADFGPAVPPGCVPLGLGLGSTLTCSDKLMVWCALGVQGAALSASVAPVRPASITVGRKFHGAALRRAVCCRTKGWLAKRGRGDAELLLFAPERCPAVMCTAMVQNTGNLPDEGACFDDPTALAWAEGDEAPERIDGRTGLSLSNPAAPPLVSRAALYGPAGREASAAAPRARAYAAAKRALFDAPGLRWAPHAESGGSAAKRPRR